MQDNLVSIIMPVYNAERFVRQAIQSVINQTYKDWELILIDDASTDSSVNIISEFSRDSRVKLIRSEQNQGISHTRNKGIHEARGRFLAFLDRASSINLSPR